MNCDPEIPRQFRRCEPCDSSVPFNTGWHRHADGIEIHIWPVWDAKGHNTDSVECECGPKLDQMFDGVLVTHNAWDGRRKP